MKKKIAFVLIVVFLLAITGIAFARVICPPCEGSGERSCRPCDGNGYLDHPYDDRFEIGCTDCGGSGMRHKVQGSLGGFKPGRGVVDCRPCGGMGTQPSSDD